MNRLLAQSIVEELLRKGIKECCVAAGSRNAPLVYALAATDQIKFYNCFEERSAAFFALGRIKATGIPVAVVTTSGTAAAELLPATMTAHYLKEPLLLITADRPRRFRGTGAPQTAEQLNLFGCYVEYEQDLADNEKCDLSRWECRRPAHINVCFEEPNEAECREVVIRDDLDPPFAMEAISTDLTKSLEDYIHFIETVKYPLVVVGGMPPAYREEAIQFLLKLGAPVYAEGFSSIREDQRLAPLRITSIDKLWQRSERHGYPIDGILRLGEIPTARLWRDLEEKEGKVKVLSISEHPFSGLSWNGLSHVSLPDFFQDAREIEKIKAFPSREWLEADQEFHHKLNALYEEEPLAEPSLFHHLSRRLPIQSRVYVGTSLPIREWDLAATYQDRGYQIGASRGVNGIDGVVSIFFGWSKPKCSNWALLGDLTVMYDMAGPWILSQMADIDVNLVVINNKGGQIFSRMYSLPAFVNPHDINFAPLADFWKMKYENWREIPKEIAPFRGHRLIEINPDNKATERFWKKAAQL